MLEMEASVVACTVAVTIGEGMPAQLTTVVVFFCQTVLLQARYRINVWLAADSAALDVPIRRKRAKFSGRVPTSRSRRTSLQHCAIDVCALSRISNLFQ